MKSILLMYNYYINLKLIIFSYWLNHNQGEFHPEIVSVQNLALSFSSFGTKWTCNNCLPQLHSCVTDPDLIKALSFCVHWLLQHEQVTQSRPTEFFPRTILFRVKWKGTFSFLSIFLEKCKLGTISSLLFH